MSAPGRRTQVEAASSAIVRVACRLPGAHDKAAFRRLLNEGRCAVGSLPGDRWTGCHLHPRRSGPGFSYSFVDGRIADPLGSDPARSASPRVRPPRWTPATVIRL